MSLHMNPNAEDQRKELPVPSEPEGKQASFTTPCTVVHVARTDPLELHAHECVGRIFGPVQIGRGLRAAWRAISGSLGRRCFGRSRSSEPSGCSPHCPPA